MVATGPGQAGSRVDSLPSAPHSPYLSMGHARVLGSGADPLPDRGHTHPGGLLAVQSPRMDYSPGDCEQPDHHFDVLGRNPLPSLHRTTLYHPCIGGVRCWVESPVPMPIGLI